MRATALGLLVCLLELAALRFFGALFFVPSWAQTAWAFALNAAGTVLVTMLVLRVLREAPGDEAEAAVAFSMPGMILGALTLTGYATAFPDLDPVLDGALGAHFLVQAAAAVVTGLFFTRLAPQDERL
ncbi:MAG: DUF5367 family protein [Hyphomonadaceae bacterium]